MYSHWNPHVIWNLDYRSYKDEGVEDVVVVPHTQVMGDKTLFRKETGWGHRKHPKSNCEGNCNSYAQESCKSKKKEEGDSSCKKSKVILKSDDTLLPAAALKQNPKNGFWHGGGLTSPGHSFNVAHYSSNHFQGHESTSHRHFRTEIVNGIKRNKWISKNQPLFHQTRRDID